MTTNPTQKRPAFRRMTWIIGGALVCVMVLLTSAFSRAWTLNQTLRAEMATLEPLLTAILEEQATLRAELEYAQSDDYVEEWAREHAGMTQPGETLVVPLVFTPTPLPTPIPTLIPTPTPTPAPFWQRWWRTLTGK